VLTATRQAPLAMIALACAWCASVPFAFRAGAGIADALGPLLGDIRLARSVVVGLALPSGAGGVVLAVLVPRLTALGAALASAPVSPRRAQGALALPRLMAAAFLVGPALLAALLPLGASAPGGSLAVAALAAMLGAAVAVGALVAEAALRLLRVPPGVDTARDAAVALTVLGGAAVVAEATARALTGNGVAVAIAIAGSPVVAAAAGSRWLALAASRPAPGRRVNQHARCRRVLPVVESTALALLSRASDVRAALGAAVAFGIAGVAAGRVAGDAGSGVLLGAGVAAFTAGIAPLSSFGRIAGGRWTWSAGARWRVAAGWATVSAALVLGPCAAVTVVGLAAGAPPDALAAAASIALVSWVAGIVAGSLFPRSASALADDTLSLAAFVVALGAVLGVGSRFQAVLAGVGLPDVAASTAWLSAGVAAACALSWWRVGR
jgi:hypothetical protein